MTSRDFIVKQFDNNDGKAKTCSSIYKDSRGAIYSYYHHYPLLFKAGGLTFRNTGGYSVTTGKHIGYAGGFNAIDVNLSGCNQYSWRNKENGLKVPNLLHILANYAQTPREIAKIEKHLLDAVLDDLATELMTTHKEMASKKRQDTQVYKILDRKRDRLNNSINQVKQAIRGL